MKGLPAFSQEYFNRFNTGPVDIKPFDSKSIGVVDAYIKKLDILLRPFGLGLVHRGSTYFRIAGKGEIEFGIYPGEEKWPKVISALTSYYNGVVGKLEPNYARFNDTFEGFRVEVIVMKGREALVDLALTKYLISHPQLLKDYEAVKQKYSYSKREYYAQKDKFLRSVVERIPEDGQLTL